MLPFAIAAAVLLLAGPAAAQTAFRASGSTVTLAATATSGRVAIQTAQTSSNVRIYNSSTTATVFVQCGNATVVATTTAGMPVAPGTVEIINCSTHLAGITASGTASLYLTPGSGL